MPPPPPAPGFHWTPAPWGVQLVADGLADFPHGWTTRQLQLRGTAGVEANGWDQVAAAAGVERGALVRMRQMHGTAVYSASDDPSLAGVIEADAAISANPLKALTVQVADCVPLLLGDPVSGTVAVAHAGWRGTMGDISGKVVRRLVAADQALPTSRLRAAIGPSIGPCCYAVGLELREKFQFAGWSADERESWFEFRDGRWYLDLWRANGDQLARQGVPRDAIQVSRLCTACHPEWFPSYRRDGPGAGRMAGFVASHP
jgi:YfiH family protein